MKAVSLLQPYASLLFLLQANGERYKKTETRSWATAHRGELAIHASAGKPKWCRQVCETDPIIQQALREAGLTFDTLPRGALLGTLDVTGCRRFGAVPSGYSFEDLACGDFTPGRWGWDTANPRPFPAPVPCSGALSIWQVPADVVAAIGRAVSAPLPTLQPSLFD